ncbi:MAG: invasion associated locus B family protein [Rhizobiaceae bacterium]
MSIPKRVRDVSVFLLAVGLVAQTSAGAAAGAYSIRQSEMLAGGATPGEVQRVTRPFANWLLICDENLKAKTRVCNVTQTIVDDAGQTVFSWSLAATEAGKPMLILRAPAGMAAGKVVVSHEHLEKPLEVGFDGCDASICVATQQVGPRFKRAIAEGAGVRITLRGASGETSFGASFQGLAQAVKSIGG